MSTETLPGPVATARNDSSALRLLDRSLIHGIAWTSGAKWGGQLLAWASTLIVARLLTPEDYGLVGMAAVYMGLVTLVSEFGLGYTVITMRDLTDHQVAEVNGLSLIVGCACFALSCAAAAPLGRFFHAPQLPAVIVAMSTAFIITAFKTVPLSLLQRELRFRTLAVVDTGRSLTLALGMILFALAGFRYWTLVIGGLLSATLSTAAILLQRRHAFAWPRLQSLRHAIKFSGSVLVSRLSWYTYSNADFLVAGRVLGKAALGLYEFGWNLANLPVEKITALIGEVTSTIFAAVQRDPAALRRYLLRITEGIALVTFPATWGIALVAPDFVVLVLGEKWRGAIVPLQILAVSTGLRSITPLLAQVLNAVGLAGANMGYGLLCAGVLVPAFYGAAKAWGTAGLAMAWLIVYPLLVLPAAYRALKAIHLSAREYLASLWPAASATIFMCAAVLAARLASGQLPRGARLAIEIATGAVSYVLTCLVMHRSRLLAFRRLLVASRHPPVDTA